MHNELQVIIDSFLLSTVASSTHSSTHPMENPTPWATPPGAGRHVLCFDGALVLHGLGSRQVVQAQGQAVAVLRIPESNGGDVGFGTLT